VGFQANVQPYFWTSDLLVHPSAYETFCLSVFQAAAAGLPIVATRLYGVEEFLQDGVNGYLVEREVNALTQLLERALSDKAKLAAMGTVARNLVRNYDVVSFVARWQSILDSFV
jgi:UDP-glucose:(heptosyl)LPS alpha-1,3-glucosyltransferase